MKDKLIIGLDVGSSAIRVAVGQILVNEDRSLDLSLIGAAEVRSEGISKASISSLEDAVSVISTALDQAERVIGLPIKEVYPNIGGTQVKVQDATGAIGVSRADKTIRHDDIERSIEAAKTYAQEPNYEIIHVLPTGFILDDQSDIKDPLGMQGVRLESKVKVIQGLANHSKNITQAIFRANVDIAEFVYTPLASAESVLSKKEKELGVCLINIGASTTSMAVYENGELVYATVFSMGSDHITSDLVYTLRTSFDVAEKLKRARGNANPKLFKNQDKINLSDFGSDSDEVIQVAFIAEVIEARIEEFFEKIEEKLKEIGRSGMLPAGIVLTGGGAKLPGITDVARKIFHLPAEVGDVKLKSSIPELIQDPVFSTAVGLVKWGYENEKEQGSYGSRFFGGQKINNVTSKISGSLKKIFKSFIP